eukprot:7388709-Prymnesium_polylepis.1
MCPEEQTGRSVWHDVSTEDPTVRVVIVMPSAPKASAPAVMFVHSSLEPSELPQCAQVACGVHWDSTDERSRKFVEYWLGSALLIPGPSPLVSRFGELPAWHSKGGETSLATKLSRSTYPHVQPRAGVCWKVTFLNVSCSSWSPKNPLMSPARAAPVIRMSSKVTLRNSGQSQLVQVRFGMSG